MKNNTTSRTQWLHLRLSTSELQELKRRCNRTTCRGLSDYARRMLLHQKITAYTRNQSLDDFLAELILVRSQLQSACSDFQKVVEKLQNTTSTPELQLWLHLEQKAQTTLLDRVESIQDCITKIYRKWLQELPGVTR
jgi:hypothetical protein